MPLPYPIAPSQTDAKSPIDQQLMDALRLNQEYLETQVGAGSAGGVLNFRVNGTLARVRESLHVGTGKALDGGIISNATTFSGAKLYLERGGTSGKLEVDVYRNRNLQHAIETISAQYSGATQSIGRLGSPLNTQAVSIATPIIDTQQITKPKAALDIESICVLEDDDVLYTFSGTTPLDADYQIGDNVLFSSCANANNNGEKVIKAVNYDGLPSILVSNALGVDQTTAVGTAVLSLYEYTYLAIVDDDIVAGESVILAGHTTPANNGTREVYKTNQGGNNIWFKYAGGATQGGVAGTAQTTRWVYVYSSAPADTQYIVGEKADFTGHTSGANNGKFIIRRVNEGGDNLYVTNLSGVAQAGAAGVANTLRWLYTMPTDPSSDIAVNDTVVLTGHTNALNDGTFNVQFVKRFTIDNIEIYNENGVAQAGIAGTLNTALKIVSFRQDHSAQYIANTSKVILEGVKGVTGNVIFEFDVKEINRGLGLFNLVIFAPELQAQACTSGRVAREIRSIFVIRPKLETEQDGVIRNFQQDDGATFAVGGVSAGDILTLEILEIPQGKPLTMVLSLV
jgi:hypothetical protein